MNVQLLGVLLGQLAIIAADPALGYRGAAIIKVLSLISTALHIGDEATAGLRQLQQKLQEMVELNREPTKDEWAALRDLAKMQHELIGAPAAEASQE